MKTENIPLEDIPQLIKRLRKEKGWSQTKLGEVVGVKKSRISKIESGIVNPSLLTLSRVFGALGVRLTFNVKPGESPQYVKYVGKSNPLPA